MTSLVSSKHYVRYDGKVIETTVTDKQAIANEWVRGIYSKYSGIPMVVGLDVEWRPTFIQSTSNKSATLQLCIDTKCLILQLFYMDAIPNLVKDFLKNPNFTFVGVEVGDDALKLNNEYGLKCSKCKDILELARAKWPGRYLRKPGLKVLASDVCGLYMQKPIHVCRSNWEARVLSAQQIEYGCIDAYASYKIGYNLLIMGN